MLQSTDCEFFFANLVELGMKMAICVYLCSDECIVSDCCKFGGTGMMMSICVYLCSDECIVSDCCNFGGIGIKMSI